MDSATFDLDDREAGVSISLGMMIFLGMLVAFHVAGLRFAGGVSGSAAL
jgi:hypothetical protein